jgi:hypothetical protein
VCSGCGFSRGERLSADGRAIVVAEARSFEPEALPQPWANAPRGPALPFYLPHSRGNSNVPAIVSLSLGVALMPLLLFGWWLILVRPLTSLVFVAIGMGAIVSGIPGVKPQVGRGKAITGLVMGIAGCVLVGAVLAMRFIFLNP